MYHAKKIIATNAFGIALLCNLLSAMESAPPCEQKNNKQQPSLRQVAMPILEGFLPKVLAAIVCDYLPPDYHTYQHYKTIGTDDLIRNYQWSHDGRHILVCHGHHAALYNTQTGEPLYKVDYTFTNQPRGRLHPNNPSLLIKTRHNQLQLHDFITQEARTLFDPSYSFYNAIFNGDGSSILAHFQPKESYQHYIGLFNTSTGANVSSTAIETDDKVATLALSSDSSRIAFAVNHTACLLLQDPIRRISLLGQINYISDMCFSQDAQELLTAHHDKTAKLWEVASGKQLRTFSHPSWVTSIHLSPIAEMFLTGCVDGKMRLFNQENDKQQFEFIHESAQYAPTFSPDGSLIATSTDHELYLWKDPSDKQAYPAACEFPKVIKSKKRHRNDNDNNEEEE